MSTQTPQSCRGSDCCPPAAPKQAAHADQVRDSIREGYAAIARAGAWAVLKAQPATQAPTSACCAPASGGGCCGPATLSPAQLAAAIGYSSSDLASAPGEANLGLSCGNPTALASLAPGEVVLDLGAGAGLDCFVAGPKVGPAGKAIGVDMTPDMLSRARSNLPAYTARTGLSNIEFRLGEIEHLPVADASVDVVISNCVINLSPDKPAVWREIARVLKPGGRVAVSDLALLRPLPEAIKADLEALVGCVAGAVLVEETRAMAAAAGLADLVLTSKPQYVEAMHDSHDPLYLKILQSLPAGSKPSDYVTSLDLAARKPR
ncbi:MAG: arsenite methyltransferase [Tepidisphaera sp.]|nr:arsenite methyltransferase [Tepidisphaera sp.]